MAASITQNAFKGYTYQQYVYCFVLSKMDTERCFREINAEVISDHNSNTEKHNFEDITVVSDAGINYHIQAKNYPRVKFENIDISDAFVTIHSNKIVCSKSGMNILFINAGEPFPTNSKIFGLDAYNKGNVYIIRFDAELMENQIEQMFQSPSRALDVIRLAYERCISGDFSIAVNELPPLKTFSTKLEEETVYIRQCMDSIDEGILCVLGKPGVGKSHFVEEIKQTYPEAIIYRFWIRAQDSDSSNRTRYDRFIADLAVKVFGSSRRFTEQQLIEEINQTAPIIIIDGLDHIENYYMGELDNYFRFINSITHARVLVLSRPLKRPIEWPTVVLENWGREETFAYLSEQNLDYVIMDDIYQFTDGYPLLVAFCLKHFLKYGTLNLTSPISDLDEYYSLLMDTVDTKRALSLFLLTSSYFTDIEIQELSSYDYAEIISEYIQTYPYLFERNVNRVSLIHDSLNTFLRKQADLSTDFKNPITDKIKTSISSGEIRYLSRINSIDFDDEFFIANVLKQYSDFNLFKAILEENVDFESVKEFYCALKLILEEREDALDIYQYYSFILICLIVERNDFVGMPVLLYNHITYLINNGIEDDEIFSNGVFWATYRLVRYKDNSAYLRPFHNFFYEIDSQVDDFEEAVKQDERYFEILERKIEVDKALEWLKSVDFELDVRDALVDIICYSYINKLEEYSLFSAVDKYINKDDVKKCEQQILHFASPYMRAGPFRNSILIHVIEKLKSLGYLKKDNLYFDLSLEELIVLKAGEGSFRLHTYLENYLRLANHCGKKIDIKKLWMFYYMYYNRKDYTVISIPTALLVFEKHNLILEQTSLHLIRDVMQQSEKGIRNILTEYIDGKDDSFIISETLSKMYEDDSYSFDIFDFSATKISLIPEGHVVKRLFQELQYGRIRRDIEFHKIYSALKSTHCGLILKIIRQNGYSISNVYDVSFLSLSGIKTTPAKENEQKKNNPFEDGFIRKEDIDYLKEHNLSCIEISCFTDGWHACFAIPEIYNHFPKRELQRNALEIIHTSMFARYSRANYLGRWEQYLGNLPKFLDSIGHEVDWNKLFRIFQLFINLSQIPNGISNDEIE